MPAIKKSYEKCFPDYEFINHCKEKLEDNISIWDNSRYQKMITKCSENEVIGILYLSMNEFSFPAANEAINKLPENFVLSGAYEIMTSIIAVPELLFKKEKYPPLLWFSALKNKQDDNLSYHIEPYGYNLTFNIRAHLNEAAEYWWHSTTLIE